MDLTVIQFVNMVVQIYLDGYASAQGLHIIVYRDGMAEEIERSLGALTPAFRAEVLAEMEKLPTAFEI